MPPTTNFASALTAVSRTLHRWARFTPPKGCIRTAPTTRTLDVARPFTWNSPHSRSRQSSTFSFAEGRRQSQHRSHASAGTTGSVVALASMTGLATYLYTTDDPRFNLYGTPRHRFNGVRTPRYGNARDLKHAIAEIRALTSEETISTDDEDLLAHGYSEWSTTNIDQMPVAVAYPKTTVEVADIAKICYKYRVPMIPYSGGTSLEGNFSAPFGGMSIDFVHMDKIIALHEADMDVVVQPAVSWMNLNEQIKDSGLFFPVDPGPSAKIGGMVGTSCSGTNAVRYGTMKDWTINLTVVLADGTIVKTKKRPRKSSAGYNLTSLFVGSEGTLGLVTEVTLKLAVIPQETNVAVVTFPTVRDAATAAAQVMRAGIQVAAMEIMDEVQMYVVNKSGSTSKKWKEVPTLFFKFSGTKAGVEESISTVKAITKCHKAGDFEFARDAEEQKTLWSARKEALWSMLALREKGSEVWSTDVAVPLSRLSDIIEISKKEMDDLGLFASVLGHIGDGNFHESILYDKNNPNERDAVEKCVHDMVDRALEMDGTCTGEHGVGLGKKEYLLKELGLDTIGLMMSIKAAMDPRWLLNPGKIMDIPS